MVQDDNKNVTHRPKLSPAYYDAAHILKMMSLKKGSINMLISTLKDQRIIKQVYALAIKVIQNQKVIKLIKEKLKEKPNEKWDPFLVEVLISDLLFGQRLFTKYRRINEVKYVLDNENDIVANSKKVKTTKVDSSNDELRLRYIRVNLLKTTKDDLAKTLETNGFTLKNYVKSDVSFDDFKKLALSLELNQFLFDYHFDDILVFKEAATKQLTELDIYKDYHIAIQDKSSILAIEAMSLEPGMKVFDACAAPGMKTVAVASRLNNDCTLYANDMNAQRSKQLKTFLHKFGANCKKILNADFSQLDPTAYPELDVILLDPSCSGSGMNRRFDYEGDIKNEASEILRCQRLAKFQLILLETALKFGAKRIVYCTCSKLQIENEDVINHLIENNSEINYEVIDPLPDWPVRGTGDYEFSKRCLRADLESTLTGGFFCCVLQRKSDSIANGSKPKIESNVDNQVEHSMNGIEEEAEVEVDGTETIEKVEKQSPKKKRNKKNKKQNTANDIQIVEEEIVKEEEEEDQQIELVEQQTEITTTSPNNKNQKNKKRKSTNNFTDNSVVVDDEEKRHQEAPEKPEQESEPKSVKKKNNKKRKSNGNFNGFEVSFQQDGDDQQVDNQPKSNNNKKQKNRK